MRLVNVLIRNDEPKMILHSIEVARDLVNKHGGKIITVPYLNQRDCNDYLNVLRQSKEKSFDKKKKELRSWYKKYKVGMLKWDQIPPEIQALLKKYYGVFGEDK
jgi:hypothetical protein